ncbi:MAG: hypothetical protein ABW185_23720 [Sedimenticola sp.]
MENTLRMFFTTRALPHQRLETSLDYRSYEYTTSSTRSAAD